MLANGTESSGKCSLENSNLKANFINQSIILTI